MDLEAALLAIASRNDGIVRSTPARVALIDAGVLRGNRNSASHALCTALSDSPQFVREAPGRHKMVNDDDAATPDGERLVTSIGGATVPTSQAG